MSTLGQNKNKLIFFLIIIATALLFFSLGYLAAEDKNRTPIIIEKNSKE